MISPLSFHWHVLGAGAIGCLLASHLYRSGKPVTLVTRDASATHRFDNGLQLCGIDGEHSLSIPCVKAEKLEQIEALLITTKANDAASAFRSVASRLTADAPVVLLHNGQGIYQQLSTEYPDINLFCGTTTEAAYFDEEKKLNYVGRGSTGMGQPGSKQPPAWFEELASALPGANWEIDIERSLWRKLIINGAINPLTAIYGCRNGELLQNDDYRQHAQTLCEELASISRARGYPDLADEVWQIAAGVMQSTADNHSSMLLDIRDHRPSEVDYITGYLCQTARELNIPCPANETLLHSLKKLESQ